MKLFRYKFLVRTLSVFFIIEILGSALMPTLSWALTSGPTAPEATSFEPVDTTDMVNTITGDLAYNMPLLEVPGPSGSHPLSLSYHAGIMPNVEASWVGLGWTLNPGAITRLSNGLPDDFKDVNSLNRTFWEGGEMTQYTVGLSVGIANVATVSGGLTFANDTYKGRGIGGYVGAGVGANYGAASASINGRIGISPYGDRYSSAGVSLGIGAGANGLSVGANVGLSVNSNGKVAAGLGGGISVGAIKEGATGRSKNESLGTSFLGASISTGGTKSSLGLGGMDASVNNSKEGKMSTYSESFHIDIPIYYGINLHLGRDYVRYWTDEKETLKNNGSLFFPFGNVGDMSTMIYDSYHLQGTESLSKGQNPEKFLEGSFADYDVYNVNAQGLGGNIRPHHYTLSLYSQDIVKYDGTKEVLGYYIPQHSSGVHYRFTNDFSNRVINDAPPIEINKTYQTFYNENPSTGSSIGRVRDDEDYENWTSLLEDTYSVTQVIPLLFPYGNPKTGIEGHDDVAGTKRRIPHVPGSKHIEYFTNTEILNSANDLNLKAKLRQRGFMEANALGFTRSKTEGEVGSFAITNESGMTYHFSLPAYSYSEFSYQQNKDVQDKVSFNNLSQKGKYAYTWYLTAITGPDFVDRGVDGNPDGLFNEFDWGHWVEFNYGRWTSDFAWRNPAIDFNTDIDSDFQTVTMGLREVYYLNAISTKTHTALFVKEIRADAKSSVRKYYNSGPVEAYNGVFRGIDEGSFDPAVRQKSCGNVVASNEVDYNLLPRASLRLNSIYLFNKDDLSDKEVSDFTNLNNGYNHVNTNFPATGTCLYMKVVTHEGENVLDILDAADPSFPKKKALRSIDFSYSYALSKQTPNSFDEGNLIYNHVTGGPPDAALYETKLGKLTLEAITFRGKDNLKGLPPVKFQYDFVNQTESVGNLSSLNVSNKTANCQISSESSSYNVGDIIIFKQGNNSYYGYIKTKTTVSATSINIGIKLVSEDIPVNGAISNVKKTKNPPYNKDLFDIWGFYKMDFGKEDNVYSRFTSELSSKNVDVWSLRRIINSTGSVVDIEYESDTYSNSVMENLVMPVKESLTYTSPTIPCTDPDHESDHSHYWLEIQSPPGFVPNFTKRQYTIGEQVFLPTEFFYRLEGYSSKKTNTIYASIVSISNDKIILSACYPFVPAENESYTFSKGFCNIKPSILAFGGGLRVKRVNVIDDASQKVNTTKYAYDFEGVSSGVTSYEPVDNNINFSSFSSLLYSSPFQKVLSMAREIPAPGIYYGKVRIMETISREGTEISLSGYSDIEFETFNKGMIDIERTVPRSANAYGGSQQHRGQNYDRIDTRNVSIRDFTQRLGSLKSITLYDINGNKINQTINHYLHDELPNQSFTTNSSQYPILMDKFKDQGVIHETFNHARWVKYSDTRKSLLGLISKKENYPAIQTGSTTINYKTGVTTTSKTLGFDFYSGAANRTLQTDGYGNAFLSESIAAYEKYPQMGLKAKYESENFSNKHMLTQQAASTTFKVDPFTLNEIAIVSASAQTWSDQIAALRTDASGTSQAPQSGIWRKQASYSFIGNDAVTLRSDGLHPASEFVEFNAWTSATTPNNWQKNSEITLYDVASHALEAKDMNGDYAATKTDSKHERVLATAANAAYTEFAYSGAEDELVGNQFGGQVFKGGALSTVKAHTGTKSIEASAGQTAFKYTATTKSIRKMYVSFWSDKDNAIVRYKINGQAPTTATLMPVKQAGNWYQLNAKLPEIPTGATLEVWCEAVGTQTYFDDFRVHPFDASMISYVYNEWGELSHILDNNNLFTQYIYDDMGRLKTTYRETLNSAYGNNGVVKVSETVINYGKNN